MVRHSRLRAAALLALVLPAVAATALPKALAQTGSFSLSWQAPAECPDETHVRRAVEQLLGEGPPPPAHVSAHAVVEHTSSGHWNVRLTTVRDGAPGERVVESESCQSLADATALILALTIDPERVAARAPGAASAPASSTVAPAAPSASAAAPAPASASPTAPPAASPAPAPSAAPPREADAHPAGPSGPHAGRALRSVRRRRRDAAARGLCRRRRDRPHPRKISRGGVRHVPDAAGELRHCVPLVGNEHSPPRGWAARLLPSPSRLRGSRRLRRSRARGPARTGLPIHSPQRQRPSLPPAAAGSGAPRRSRAAHRGGLPGRSRSTSTWGSSCPCSATCSSSRTSRTRTPRCRSTRPARSRAGRPSARR